MKVIKKGKTSIRFKCPICKCLFEENISNCKIDYHRILTKHTYVNCPNCNYKIEKIIY